MGLDALKKQLSEGTITQEQFSVAVKELLEAGTITQEEHDEALKVEGSSGGGSGTFDSEAFLKSPEFLTALQSAGDKVRTEYTKKLKDKEDELEKLKREKMTADELAADDLAKAQKALAEKTEKLNAREVALHTVDKLTELKLPLGFKGFLAASNTEDTDKNITEFQKEWSAALQQAVKDKFKENGGDPGGGQGGGGEKNPWMKDQWNLTEQGKILSSDREKAKRLATAAGYPNKY